MRSRSNSLEDVTKAKRSAERGEPSGRAERRGRHRELPDDTGTIQRSHKMAKNATCTGGSSSGAAKAGRREKGRDLSRDDLVFLLSLLEGELQVKSTEQTGFNPLRQALTRAVGPRRTYTQTR